VIESRRTFYLTTPIYYVNDRPHLGHAYTTILADAMARYRRLAGDDVWFLTGTDEHGDNIAQTAAKAGIAPQVYADRIAAEFRKTWDRLGITYDDFIRTTEDRHQKVVQHILQKLNEAGEIYLGKYGGQYCYGCERFYTEKEIVDGKCPDHQTPLTYIEEENYFFRMSKYQEWLVGYINAHPDLIRPERYRNEILGFLRDPLQDLSISRPKSRLQWGIPLPFDDRYVTYVWFDALINYVSALGYPDGEKFSKYWPQAQHLIGKDILKPHAIYWPCMLAALAAAEGKPREALMYRHLNVHGYWSLGGGKMSKSVGNVVEALALTEKYRDRNGNDAFRYFVMREMTFGLDANFSEEAFVARFNADLANDLGNLVARPSTLIAKHGAGISFTWGASGAEITDQEEELRSAFAQTVETVVASMEEFAFHRALATIWDFIARLNRYIDGAAPWELAKHEEKRPRLEGVLVALAESLRCVGIILTPFLPEAAAQIRAALGQAGRPRLSDGIIGQSSEPVRVTASRLRDLFPRIDVKTLGAASTPASATESLRASVEDFAKLDLRVAEVIAAEPVPKSKRLLKLTVSLGDEQRTLVAGIAEHYTPADLVGKKIVIVANLEPVKLMGVESHGMLLAGSAGDKLAIITLDRDLPPGAKVK